MNVENLQNAFRKLHEESNKLESEEELRSALLKSKILENLGYGVIGKDIRLEKGVEGKRCDIICLDEYRNVVFVIELKKPNNEQLEKHSVNFGKSM